MTPKELWQAFLKENPNIRGDFKAWSFGVEADKLANLVLQGTKTATSSAYDLYAIDGEDLPKEGSYDIILDHQGQAVCIVETTKVEVLPFKDVSAEHAFKEGEGDRSLAYWQDVHKQVFTEWLSNAGIPFTEDTKFVLEEFQVVYPHR